MKTSLDIDRIQELKSAVKENGRYVLYWMQQSQRAEWNQALEFALELSQEKKLGVLVVFGLMDDYPEANLRHYSFMLEGLKEVEQSLKKRQIKFVLEKAHPVAVATKYAGEAAAVVCDRGYLKHQREWRKQLAAAAECPVYQVEADVVVPVELSSPQEEYAARTLRPKLHKHFERFNADVQHQMPGESSLDFDFRGEDLSDIPKLLGGLKIKREPGAVTKYFEGGTAVAKKRFRSFLDKGYYNYVENRNQPYTEDVSHMSPYLHFGQISPLWLLHELKSHRGKNKESFVEELVVRRELAANFCFYNLNYDSLNCLPHWARQSLEKHRDDEREKVYSLRELENAETHDPYWNAAMKMMKERGYLHNHMRMYWGKQIIRFTNTPEYAHKVALELNNKYFLDGRDCNSFSNIAWLFGKHDQGWAERPVFGKVRTMTPGGLERKTNTKKYLEKLQSFVQNN